MKKLITLGIALLTLAACNMDFYRSDVMTSNMLKANPDAAVYTTDGIYSLFKDNVAYRGKSIDGMEYARLIFQMTEFRGDNVCLSGETSDPLCQQIRYNDFGAQKSNYYMWWIAYKVIYAANSNIEAMEEGASALTDHMLGENYFFRAIGHFHLVELYAKQYALGRDNLGVVLRTSTDCSETHRATVGEVYDQIVLDLQKAMELMKGKSPRGDKGFVSYEAAAGLLTRVYLYMEKNQECLDLCNELLGSDPSANLMATADLPTYFANARTAKETIWCLAHNPTDTQARGSIGSMYYSTNGTGGEGWGEMYWADPLIELFQRYPDDKRFAAYFSLYGQLNDGTKMVHWPINDGVNNFRPNAIVAGNGKGLTPDKNGNYTFSYQGKTYTTVYKSKPGVNNGYPQYFINYEGQETQVFVRDNTDFASGVRNTYPQYYMSKFAWQDGDPNLSSPVILRWAEIILNRAEVEAKLGQDEAAIKDINILRKRAGIHEWANLAECKTHEYKSALEVVLDERRMELCFEGHRAFDVYRNRLSMDRRFAGVQPWEVVDCNDLRIPYQIPDDEILVSDIEQNPR
ncbi:MAG: RagB/SusD family nutrient uptake outer membrane protein [Bacteroidales bacterium]|nr:RagB/SusD family nutrient uptake outer membrane protein [Bacteroidales bacterium]